MKSPAARKAEACEPRCTNKFLVVLPQFHCIAHPSQTRWGPYVKSKQFLQFQIRWTQMNWGRFLCSCMCSGMTSQVRCHFTHIFRKVSWVQYHGKLFDTTVYMCSLLSTYNITFRVSLGSEDIDSMYEQFSFVYTTPSHSPSICFP